MRIIISFFLLIISFSFVFGQQSKISYINQDGDIYETVVVDFIPRHIYLVDDSTKGVQTIGIVALTNGNLQAINQLGVQINSQIGNIITAAVPIDIFDSIRNLPDIIACEPAKACHSNMDVSSNFTGANLSRTNFGITGSGVIIGIVDSHIDIANSDFQNGPNDSRIIFFWSQNETGSPHPLPFNYGREWTKNDIDNGSCTFVASANHGTMVTGIAAGNGNNGSAFCGIAPESDIIFVDRKVDASGLSTYNNVIDAVKYIADKAESRNQPCVINLSLGSCFGTRDGSSLFDQALDSILANHIGKGLAIVVAAGNNGFDPANPQVISEFGCGYKWAKNKHHYNSYVVGRDTIELVVGSHPGDYNDQDYIEIFYPSGSSYVSVIAPDGQCSVGPYGPGQGTGAPNMGYQTNCGLIFVHNEHWGTGAYSDPYPTSSENCIRIVLQDVDSTINEMSGSWKIVLENIVGRVDAYLAKQTHNISGIVSFFPIWTNDNTLQEPATAQNVIAVGSFNTKNSWINWRGDSIPNPVNPQFQATGFPLYHTSFFSSQGPTRDGRDKPEIYAPGAWIASSYAPFSYVRPYNPWKMASDSDFVLSWGTSFAAPHVTGTIALMLEKNDTLSYRSIKDILVQTATLKYLNAYKAVSVVNGWGSSRGDINLNGAANEIGDLVVFTNYFIADLAAFVINPEAQMAAADINGDGIVLGLNDFVYLIRIIVGDALPLAKRAPGVFAEFYSDGTSVRVKTPVDVGAALFVFKGKVYPTVGTAASGMEVKYAHVNGMTRALVYTLERGRAISSGEVLNLSGQGTLISVEAATYEGAILATNRNFQLPNKFELSQNYPNPFNPTTTIELALPVPSDWTITIYNVSGQTVAEFTGHSEAGIVSINWDAYNMASGMYFYKATAGTFAATKKMVILK
jgi:subtilisin family serine protease